MITKELQALIDAPLADPNKLYVPKGAKRVISRGPRPEYHCDKLPKLTRDQVQERKVDARSQMIAAMLDYYATTQIPFDRIAQHTGLAVEKISEAMKDRGRVE